MNQALIYWIKTKDGKLHEFIIRLAKEGHNIVTITPTLYSSYKDVKESVLIEAIIITIMK